MDAAAVVTRWYDEMWAPGNWRLVPELAGPTYTRHEFGATRVVTADEYQSQVRGVCESWDISEMRYRLLAADEHVTAIGSWLVDGSQWSWVQVFRVESDKLVETWLSGIHTDGAWAAEVFDPRP